MTANLKLDSIDVVCGKDSDADGTLPDMRELNQMVWLCDGSLYSRLLVDLVQRKTGFYCRVQQASTFRVESINASALYLIDHTRFAEAQLIQLLAAGSSMEQCRIALWNLEQADDCARYLPWSALKGVFYRNSSEALLIKGIRTLAAGCHWFTRHQLDLIAAQRISPECHHGVELSQRELEILRSLAEGKSNQLIADELSRSLHTVKSHLYNLYRKLSVRNRNQAVHWASRNRLL